ncbi:alpha/beta fold hydrolase [Marimonas sp. MJW-29]|uniref:Alpha/beta fold hydrolase n=1 Tax=Sulfitobacter sediminis TaxID=3234186 RepID=A0ABV3RNP5_9RHOB
MVVFSGVGRFPDEYPAIEFFRSATQDEANHALFVSDFSRSWLNWPGMDAQIADMVASTAAENGIDDIALIGNSMGGTMALLMARRIPARTVMAFVPQYSVSPQIMPEEKRWRKYRANISAFIYPEVTLEKTDDQTVYIVHGGTGGELAHALKFPLIRGIRHFILPQYGHNHAKMLNRKAVLAPLIGAALAERRVKVRKIIEADSGLFLRDFKAGLDTQDLQWAGRA